MIPLYFITSEGSDPLAVSWLDQELRWTQLGPERPTRLLCYLNPEDAAKAVAFVSQHRNWVGRIRVRKMMGGVFPSNIDDTDDTLKPVSDKVFIHADRGPYRYYVIREEGGFFLNISSFMRQLETHCRDATTFSTHSKAFEVLSTIRDGRGSVYMRDDESGGPASSLGIVGQFSDFSWRVEKRQGFVAEREVSPRILRLMSKRSYWSMGSLLVRPDFETF